MSLVNVERREGIAIVRLDRPDKRNAMSFALLRELLAHARNLHRDRTLRAVVLCGAGESFSAGIDLADLTDRRHRLFGMWELLKPWPSLFQQAFLAWRELPVPVIAAVHGHCFGAGMQLALAADVRVASPDCQLSILEAKWGLVPDMGITRSLRGVLPADIVRDLVFSARIVRGDEALTLGLVTRVDASPLDAALALADEYAQRSPDALLAAKRVIQSMLEGSPGAALRAEKRWQLRLMLGRNADIARRRAKQPDLSYAPRDYS
jgi:enoyl-CoA hydratase/carnithine racemase